MRRPIHPLLKVSRVRHPLFGEGDGLNSAFRVRAPSGRSLNVISSDQIGWDHVSVSVADSDVTPTWEEMCWIKDLFFDESEVVVQYHPAKSAYINIHPGCLHLWRCQSQEYPMPPLIMV